MQKKIFVMIIALKEERKLLVQIISKKYGSPSITQNVDLSDLDKGYISSRRWKTCEKFLRY